MSVAILASLAWVNWKSASTCPNILREVARESDSSSARRAKPRAAAATDERKISRVDMAILNPWPESPRRCAAGTLQFLKVRRHDGNALSDLKTGSIRINDKGRDAFGAGLFASSGKDYVEIGNAAVRDPGFLAIEQVRVAIFDGRTLESSDVRSSVGFRDSECRDGRTLGHRRKIMLLLLLSTKIGNRSGAQSLHGKGEIGKPGMASQGFTNEANGASVNGFRRGSVD